MELIRGIHNLQPRHYGCVLTIGNFDGFHRGHQELISQLQSENYGLSVMVIIFEPQPQEYFSGNTAPARLTRLRDKIKYLSDAGVDTILCITFNKHLADLGANTFISDLLVKKLGVQYICVGDDFRFGSKRIGDFSLLQQVGASSGFKVKSTATYTENGLRISSTIVREALAQDRLIEAEILLGHSYRISGRVLHGDELGRTIGFPTANVSLKGKKSPINGVYAVKVYGLGLSPKEGVANIGVRPTISGNQQRLEVHLLDVAQDIYGKHIEVVICAKVRNEKKFNSLNALRKQIENDIASTREFFE